MMMESCPFADPAMKRALVGAVLVILGGAPLGVMLVLRRMSLMGDVIAHAILPGTAAGFIVAGLSVPAMSLGGLIAGLVVAFFAGLATRFTAIREDASLAAFYLLAVALGILMIALHGSAQDLEDILFGNAESIDDMMLIFMGAVTSVTLVTLAVIMAAVDRGKFRSGFHAFGARPRRPLLCDLHDAAGFEHGGRLPDGRHRDGGRADADPGGGGAIMVAAYRRANSGGPCAWLDFVGGGPMDRLSAQAAVRPGDYSGRRRLLYFIAALRPPRQRAGAVFSVQTSGNVNKGDYANNARRGGGLRRVRAAG